MYNLCNYFTYRENGDGGGVFCILFETKDKKNFILSNFIIGNGTTLISPVCEGEWAGTIVLKSDSPCLCAPANFQVHIPTPFPETVRLFQLTFS